MTDEKLKRCQQVWDALEFMRKRAAQLKRALDKPFALYSLNGGDESSLVIVISKDDAVKILRRELKRTEKTISELQKEWNDL